MALSTCVDKVIFGILYQFLGTPCRYYMVIFGHQFLGTEEENHDPLTCVASPQVALS